MRNELRFAAGMWLLSRLVVAMAMLLIAPALPAPPGGSTPNFGWGVFSAWDSGFYQQIATSGYGGDNVAFFPLFPLCIRALMLLGLPAEVAGTLVNNLAFLGALLFLSDWIARQHGASAARWSVAVLAWCPLSLFGTVVYTEGLYLLCSTATLRAFEFKQYFGVALWGTLATATRPTGIAIVPALIIAAWKERRPPLAYLASLAASSGLLLYSLYCRFYLGDWLAFGRAQQQWKRSLSFDVQGWWKMLMQISIGTANWKAGSIQDPLHPLLFVTIIVLGYCLWRWRTRFNPIKVGYGFCVLVLALWLLAGDPLLNTVAVLGGIYLLWHLRHQLTPVVIAYGFCGLGLLLFSGSTWSLTRLVYGIISLPIALGLLLSRYPRWGYVTLGFFTLLLILFSVRFAQALWIA
jgi:Gpi18-like mannosyltransferase